MVGFLNWVGRIVLFYFFRAALYLMFPVWRLEIRAVMYVIFALWIYNDFPALRRAVLKWLNAKPDVSYDKDNWVELKDFAALSVSVLVILVGSRVARTFLENLGGPEVYAGDNFYFLLIMGLYILTIVLVPMMFIRYSWAVIRGKKFFKIEDADKQDTDEKLPVENDA